MVEKLILIPAVLGGLAATAGTYWHANRLGGVHPARWSVAVGLTVLLSPFLVDEVVFTLWQTVTTAISPLSYYGLVFGLTITIYALLFRHYTRNITLAQSPDTVHQ